MDEHNNKKYFLMIKKLLDRNIKYLCKTNNKKGTTDAMWPYKYPGSGRYWKSLVHKYGEENVITCVIGVYDTAEELKEQGIYYSKIFNVVASDDWANLTEEKGDGGLIGTGQLGKNWKMSDQARENVSIAQKKRAAKYKEHMQRLHRAVSGELNHQFKYYIITPWGKFTSLTAASKAARKEYNNGNKNVIRDVGSLKNRINNLDVVFTSVGHSIKEWVGENTKGSWI